MYICVDFDGTIVDHVFPEIGQPVPHAIRWMKDWYLAGAKLILWTMRSGEYLEAAELYLQQNDITLHGVNENPDQHSWTSSPKAYANLYIDDAAYGCPTIQPEGFGRLCVDWSIVGPDVHNFLATELGG